MHSIVVGLYTVHLKQYSRNGLFCNVQHACGQCILTKSYYGAGELPPLQAV